MSSPVTRLQQLSAEFVGTFALVYVGTGAIVVNAQTEQAVTHLGVALCFGFVVAAMIYSIGNISGAHINPAVTLALWVARRCPARDVAPYIASQCVGAIIASVAVSQTLGDYATLGATLPAGSWQQSFSLEVIITFLLVFVIVNVTAESQSSQWLNGTIIGVTVALAALFAGPICGASMNPARSLGPAVVSGHWQHFWLYVVAPIVGAILAVYSCRCVQGSSCCSAAGCNGEAVQTKSSETC